jgi:hypothetical protein
MPSAVVAPRHLGGHRTLTKRSASPPTSPTKTGLGQDQLRRNNLSALLTRVHLHGSISRASLTRGLGLNRSTIGGLAATLEDLGLVTERQPSAVRQSGRPSLVLEPRRDNVAVAVDIGVDRIVTAWWRWAATCCTNGSARTHPASTT